MQPTASAPSLSVAQENRSNQAIEGYFQSRAHHTTQKVPRYLLLVSKAAFPPLSPASLSFSGLLWISGHRQEPIPPHPRPSSFQFTKKAA